MSHIPVFIRPDNVQGNDPTIEVAFLHKLDLVLVRRSDQPDGTILCFDYKEWEDFIAGIKDGEFDE